MREGAAPPLFGPVGSETSRLIVIRGNSGSGKSSVATGVQMLRPRQTLAVISQDVLRRTILRTGDHEGNAAVDLIDMTARYALSRDFDVIIEGILNARNYGHMLTQLGADHRGITHCYLYDLTFEEHCAATGPR